MPPPFPSPTPTWRNETYSAISPLVSESSVAGKIVIINGAGSGIGRETAFAFASAGAKRIVLLGRKEAALAETKSQMPRNASCSVYAVSVTDEKAMTDILALLLAPLRRRMWMIGGKASNVPTAILDIQALRFRTNSLCQTNVKGALITAKAFLPTANSSHAAILGVTTGASALPSAMLPGLSAYIASKLAQVKFLEFLAADNPNIFVASVHPGMIDTAMFRKSGGQAGMMTMDKAELPAHFMVWLASPEAEFFKGRLVWADWDVDELKAQAKEIISGQQMTAGIVGWPFSTTS